MCSPRCPAGSTTGWQLLADVPAVWALVLIAGRPSSSGRAAVVWSALFAIVCAVVLSLVAALAGDG